MINSEFKKFAAKKMYDIDLDNPEIQKLQSTENLKTIQLQAFHPFSKSTRKKQKIAHSEQQKILNVIFFNENDQRKVHDKLKKINDEKLNDYRKIQATFKKNENISYLFSEIMINYELSNKHDKNQIIFSFNKKTNLDNFINFLKKIFFQQNKNSIPKKENIEIEENEDKEGEGEEDEEEINIKKFNKSKDTHQKEELFFNGITTFTITKHKNDNSLEILFYDYHQLLCFIRTIDLFIKFPKNFMKAIKLLFLGNEKYIFSFHEVHEIDLNFKILDTIFKKEKYIITKPLIENFKKFEETIIFYNFPQILSKFFIEKYLKNQRYQKTLLKNICIMIKQYLNDFLYPCFLQQEFPLTFLMDEKLFDYFEKKLYKTIVEIQAKNIPFLQKTNFYLLALKFYSFLPTTTNSQVNSLNASYYELDKTFFLLKNILKLENLILTNSNFFIKHNPYSKTESSKKKKFFPPFKSKQKSVNDLFDLLFANNEDESSLIKKDHDQEKSTLKKFLCQHLEVDIKDENKFSHLSKKITTTTKIESKSNVPKKGINHIVIHCAYKENEKLLPFFSEFTINCYDCCSISKNNIILIKFASNENLNLFESFLKEIDIFFESEKTNHSQKQFSKRNRFYLKKQNFVEIYFSNYILALDCIKTIDLYFSLPEKFLKNIKKLFLGEEDMIFTFKDYEKANLKLDKIFEKNGYIITKKLIDEFKEIKNKICIIEYQEQLSTFFIKNYLLENPLDEIANLKNICIMIDLYANEQLQYPLSKQFNDMILKNSTLLQNFKENLEKLIKKTNPDFLFQLKLQFFYLKLLSVSPKNFQQIKYCDLTNNSIDQAILFAIYNLEMMIYGKNDNDFEFLFYEQHEKHSDFTEKTKSIETLTQFNLESQKSSKKKDNSDNSVNESSLKKVKRNNSI